MADDNNQENVSSTSATDLIDESSKLEISYLKELLKQKDIYIISLEDKINILIEHISLLHKIKEHKPETSLDHLTNSIPNTPAVSVNQRYSQKCKTASKTEQPSHRSGSKLLATQTISTQQTTNVDLEESKSISEKEDGAQGDQCSPKIVERTRTKPNIKKITKQDVQNALESVKSTKNEDTSTNTQNDGFTRINNKKRTHRSPIVGSMKDFSKTKLKPMDKIAFLHVYKMHRDVTPDTLTEYLREMFPEVVCEKMNSKYPQYYSAFKVTVLERNLKAAMSPAIWPEGSDYVFTGQGDTQYIPFQQDQNQYVNPSDIIPFRQSPAGFQQIDSSASYLQPDLHTSDLPIHLQHTLPQYRFSTPSPIDNFQSNQPLNNFNNFRNQNSRPISLSSPSGFQASGRFLKPTTLRPNYSHLFAKTHQHNRDPSQTETFLGQITLQNPIESPLAFESFQNGKPFPGKSKDDFENGFNEDGNGNSIVPSKKPNFLNHRTRIIAPDPSKQTTQSEVNNYFINDNGEVLSTSTPNKLTTSEAKLTEANLNSKNFRNKKEYIPKLNKGKSVDLEPLLEEPLKDNFGSNNDDEVEVIQSRENNEEQENESVTGEIEHGEHNTTSHLNDEEEYEDETDHHNSDDDSEYYSDDESDTIDGSNDIQSEGHHKHKKGDLNEAGEGIKDEESEEKEKKELKEKEQASPVILNSSTYDVITTKPTSMVQENNFKDFVDTVAIDTTDNPGEIHTVTQTTTLPTVVSVSSLVSVKKGDQKYDEKIEEEPEVVISIVTSKTVVNNTIVGGVNPEDVSTEAIKPVTELSVDEKVENTTDTWVVVASVQTSRSVSGARYLPSSIVEQDVRIKLLNEHSHEEDDETTTAEPPTQKSKTSTESLIDKLDQVQSDLSSGLLAGGLDHNFAVIKDNTPDKLDMSNMDLTTPLSTTKAPYPQINIRKYSPKNRPTTTRKPRTKPTRKTFDINKPQGDQPQADLTSLLPPNYKLNASDDRSSKLLEEILNRAKPKSTQIDKGKKQNEDTEEEKVENTTKKADGAPSIETTTENSIFEKAKPVDISQFLPPGYKLPEEEQNATEAPNFKNTKADDISKFLPPGYKLPSSEVKTTERALPKNTKAEDVSKLLPPGYKLTKSDEKTTEASIFKNTKADDISKFLPPGFKLPKSEVKTTERSIFKNTKADEISKFLPPGFKLPKSEDKTTESSVFKNTKADDVSKFLPPGFKIPKYKQDATTERSLFKNTKADDLSKFLPPGYKLKTTTEPAESAKTFKTVDISAFLPPGYKLDTNSSVPNAPSNLLPPGYQSDEASITSTSTTSKPSSGNGLKVVFPSRPGSGQRKSASRTTQKPMEEQPRNTPPTIHKGWPSRATTEFTGWPTPSTTPISIEKLLEAARTASTTTTQAAETTSTSTTTTTTTTTTTPKPTTPGICVEECDLVGTIKLIGGVKWQPELLDRNTKEWQVLANEVESQLDYVYSTSSLLNKWYRKIRIDGFSEGSVLVDYLVELNDVGRKVDTQEIKKLFHESLDDALLTFGGSNREGKALNETKLEGKLSLGNFVVDPAYTDFLVLPKQVYPTVGYAENDVLLPQWAIAVIVIGLASLLFVIIFGVTVLVNRQKNAKKKSPTPLTEDMLNELNKSHMGGFDNYGADDLYNMEDVWNERAYDQKMSKKRSSGSIHDNSMSNLYDSWRSEWNGYYYNSYYGNNPGSSHSGYNGRRRSDYDTNF